MSAKYVNVSVKALLVSVLSLVMVLTFVSPVAAARPEDNLHWSACNNRTVLRSKAIVDSRGKSYGTLYLYRCSNGVFARTSSIKKSSLSVVVERLSPQRSGAYIAGGNGYHIMTNMVYVTKGACYMAYGTTDGARAKASLPRVCI